MKAITASELKYRVEDSGSNRHFFDRKTMKWWGDTMANFAVSDAGFVTVNHGVSTRQVDCWVLRRKRKTSKMPAGEFAWFDKASNGRVFPNREVQP